MFKKLIVILFMMFLTIPAFADSGKLVLDGDTLKSISVDWETNMTDQMKSVPFTCLQEAHQDGETLCDIEKELAAIKWGFPIVRIDNHKSQKITFSNNAFQFEKIQTKKAPSTDIGVFVVLDIIPFLFILFISVIYGCYKIKRKRLLIVYQVLFSAVIISYIAASVVGSADKIDGLFTGVFVALLFVLFASVLVYGSADVLAGGSIGVYTGVLVGIFADIGISGHGFWEPFEKAMIPEYLGFLLVTFLIGFVLREITFQIVNRKTQEVQ